MSTLPEPCFPSEHESMASDIIEAQHGLLKRYALVLIQPESHSPRDLWYASINILWQDENGLWRANRRTIAYDADRGASWASYQEAREMLTVFDVLMNMDPDQLEKMLVVPIDKDSCWHKCADTESLDPIVQTALMALQKSNTVSGYTGPIDIYPNGEVNWIAPMLRMGKSAEYPEGHPSLEAGPG